MSPKVLAIVFALCVACCWGMYGPTLSHARSPSKEWGAFKPYVFIGVAYLVIAIIGGSIMMRATGDNFSYAGNATAAAKWGFLAGSLGALGALFLTMAVVKSGGKPALVMPIVFGGAVTVNAIASYVSLRGSGIEINPLMWVGMAITAVGLVLVASYTPHGHPKKPTEPAVTAAESADSPATAELAASEPASS